MKAKALIVCGTRPDAIKLAPVIKELRPCDDIETIIVATGQHREMLQQVLDAFSISVDRNFDVMLDDQSLAYLTTTILNALEKMLESEKPDIVLAQGDTTTTFVAGLASFYRRIPFAHVEAGLRTESVESPFPEEFNRRAVSQITHLHFAPTERAAKNLRFEGAPEDSVFVTGNTSIDAVLDVASRLAPVEPYAAGRMLLVTAHRRESWGEPHRRVCRALLRLLKDLSDTHVVLPVHPNRAVCDLFKEELGGHERAFLIEPSGYPEFVSLMKASTLILTDSGGVQEEAPSLGKPVLVLRGETERPEGIEAGSAVLVGTDEDRIFSEASKLLTDEAAYSRMAQARNPYGDGLASKRIVSHIRRFLGLRAKEFAPFSAARSPAGSVEG